MATDISLHIVDSALRTVVCVRWLGMGRTHEQVVNVLGRQAIPVALGEEWWVNIEPMQVAEIAEASCFNGLSLDEVRSLAVRFPPPRYWWMLERGF